MTTTLEQRDQWLASPSERERLEFKEAKAQFDTTRLLRFCVATANEGGGSLILGATDTPPWRVVGTHAYPGRVATAERIFQQLGFRVDPEEVVHPGGRVLIFHIPSRPTGTAYHLEGAYLMRSGESLVPMTEDQLCRIFAEGRSGWLEEPTRTAVTSAEVVELLDTQAFFELLRLPQRASRRPDAEVRHL